MHFLSCQLCDRDKHCHKCVVIVKNSWREDFVVLQNSTPKGVAQITDDISLIAEPVAITCETYDHTAHQSNMVAGLHLTV